MDRKNQKRAALIAFLVFLAPVCLFAQSGGVKCPKRAVTERNIREAIRDKVRTMVPSNISNAKVNVKMKVVSVDPSGYVFSDDDILSGLSIVANGFPNELSFGVIGQGAFGINEICQYDYKVSVITRGIQSETNQKLVAKSESFVTVFASFGHERVKGGSGSGGGSSSSSSSSSTSQP